MFLSSVYHLRRSTTAGRIKGSPRPHLLSLIPWRPGCEQCAASAEALHTCRCGRERREAVWEDLQAQAWSSSSGGCKYRHAQTLAFPRRLTHRRFFFIPHAISLSHYVGDTCIRLSFAPLDGAHGLWLSYSFSHVPVSACCLDGSLHVFFALSIRCISSSQRFSSLLQRQRTRGSCDFPVLVHVVTSKCGVESTMVSSPASPHVSVMPRLHPTWLW
ncbi:hypothetical protein BJV74DRAFT_496606 [Russula compacta]|nr:hypothetical protein BJV74DRAFT_496606 [Russula compacta]